MQKIANMVDTSMIKDLNKAHRTLARYNQRRVNPSICSSDWEADLQEELSFRHLEGRLIERERALVKAKAAEAPTNPRTFVRWFEQLKDTGPGQNDPLFPWLETQARWDQLRWFIQQEVAGEAGFDDLVAMTQVKMMERPKLELARNYWDEMGRGNPKGMHGPMLSRLAKNLDISSDLDGMVIEALSLANVMLGFAANRRYAFHSIGALGVIELTAPTRVGFVERALRRFGVPGKLREYFALHATLDVRHSEAWNREVLAPLVEDMPEAAPAIAEGALMRLNAGARCFERYRTQFSDDLRKVA